MSSTNPALLALCLLALAPAVAGQVRAGAFDVRKPQLVDNKFWLYGHGSAGKLAFVPYAWMPENAGQFAQLDPESRDQPNPEPGEEAGSGTCMAVSVKWQSPYWFAVAFVSGPSAPPWWGEDNRGWYYDLSGLKKLVFYARGENGGERIQVKVGILGDKKYGDSLPFPVESRWLPLTKEWKRYEVDFATAKPRNRIANGFTFVLSRDQQEGNARTTRFFLDTIYME